MAFDWYEYIKLSEDLISEEKPSEAKLRSAISRAYYGAFIKCRNKLKFLNKNDIHTFIILHLKRPHASRNEFIIGGILGKLREKRNSADYDGSKTFDKLEVESSIKSAIELIKLLPKIDEED